MIRIALGGNTGAGKSTVAQIIRKLRPDVVDLTFAGFLRLDDIAPLKHVIISQVRSKDELALAKYHMFTTVYIKRGDDSSRDWHLVINNNGSIRDLEDKITSFLEWSGRQNFARCD